MRHFVILEHRREVVNVVRGKGLTAVDRSDWSVIGKSCEVVNADEIAVGPRNAQRLSPGVSQAELEATRKAAVQPNLKRVVIRAASLPMDGDVSVSRKGTQKVTVVSIASESGIGVGGDFCWILVLWQERGTVWDRVEVHPIQLVTRERTDIGRIENELGGQFVLDA